MKFYTLLLITIFFSWNTFAQITIDGNPEEWQGSLPASVNSSAYRHASVGYSTKYNEWIWRDASGDFRTDLSTTADDLLEAHLASDGTYLYYMFRIPSGFTFQPMFQISLRLPSSTSTTTSLGGFADTQVPAAAAWDYLIMTQNGGTANIVFNSEWTIFSGGTSAANSTNGVIEGRVPWSSLGGAPANRSYKITITYFHETSGSTTDIGGASSNCLDLMTTTSTTWGAVSTGTIDYYETISFLSDGSVLPVELSSFTAARTSRGVEAHWTTATETNNFGFELERNTGTGFTNAAFISGCGTSAAAHSYCVEDPAAPAGHLQYRLKQIDHDGSIKYSDIVDVPAAASSLRITNYPNPFNPSTTIAYEIPTASYVTLTVSDVLGREVAVLVNEQKNAGSYRVVFSNPHLASGTYYYRLHAGSSILTGKIVLLK